MRLAVSLLLHHRMSELKHLQKLLHHHFHHLGENKKAQVKWQMSVNYLTQRYHPQYCAVGGVRMSSVQDVRKNFSPKEKALQAERMKLHESCAIRTRLHCQNVELIVLRTARFLPAMLFRNYNSTTRFDICSFSA